MLSNESSITREEIMGTTPKSPNFENTVEGHLTNEARPIDISPDGIAESQPLTGVD